MHGSRRYRAVALLLAGILVGTAATGCAKRAGTVVRAADGSPLAGASVALADTTGRVVVVTTDGEGAFAADLGVPTLVAVTVSAPGYLPQTRAVGADRPISSWTMVPDPDPGDPDGDGLSNGAEATFGTDPTRADTDRDGLGDGDEATVRAPLGLPGLGADARHRDIFIEIDRDADEPGVGSTVVSDDAVELVRGVYAASPLGNPDGTTGITAHIDNGSLGGGEALHDVPVGYGCSFAGYDGLSHLAPERRSAFFHVLSGDLSLCSLYGYAYDTRRVVVDVGQPQLGTLQTLVAAGTILHELGHTVGLRHGGDEELRCKPNYPSVMNYNPVVIYFAGLGYSRGLQPAIDEHAIEETKPFLGYPQYDWNHDGVIQVGTYAADVDNWSWLEPGFQTLVGSVFSKTRCPVNGINAEPLHDFDDWGRIAAVLPAVVGIPLPGGPGGLPSEATRVGVVVGP